MSRLTQPGATGPLELFQTSSDNSLATMVGASFEAADGRKFVLVQNGAVALVAGNLIQGPAKVTNHQNISVTSFTAAANGNPAKVVATLGATLATANQYAGGYAIVNAGTGIGQTLKITSHPAAGSGAAITLTLEDAPAVALDATSKLCLSLNPFGSQHGTDVSTSGVIINPHAGATGQVLGVTLYPIPASTATVAQYGLIQTKGPVSCLNDATTAIGLDLMPSTNTDGAVMTYVVATGTRVGVSTQAGVTTEARLITVQL